MEISEIFQSIDGEVNMCGQGGLTTFIRLSGCNLKCVYCDTPQSKKSGKQMTVDQVLSIVGKYGCQKITITGGEPLVQFEEMSDLIDRLLDNGFIITVESNGTIIPKEKYLDLVDLGWVFDYKLDYIEQMQVDMMASLGNQNWIKIVISGRGDYKKAIQIKDILKKRGCEAKFAFSPAFMENDRFLVFPPDLVSWLVDDQQWDVVVNVQIHKLISVR